jgi:hypothetical protein
MNDTIYADGVTDVTVVGANARVRFHTLVSEGKGKPKVVHAFTLVIPVEALATFGERLPQLTEQLLQSGRLKKVQREPAKANPPN